jgi:hypothetical protein
VSVHLRSPLASTASYLSMWHHVDRSQVILYFVKKLLDLLVWHNDSCRVYFENFHHHYTGELPRRPGRAAAMTNSATPATLGKTPANQPRRPSQPTRSIAGRQPPRAHLPGPSPHATTTHHQCPSQLPPYHHRRLHPACRISTYRRPVTRNLWGEPRSSDGGESMGTASAGSE